MKIKGSISLCAALWMLSAMPVAAPADVNASKDKAAICGICHGTDGNSPTATFPNLAGQNERYLVKQMRDIKSGARNVPTMAGQLDKLDEKDFADIAAYFAGQNPAVGQAKEALVPLGERIFRGGIEAKGVPACAGCHAPRGNGNRLAGWPALRGQHTEYTAAQLRAWRSGERANDGDGAMMRTIAANLSDREIQAVASYIDGLY